MSRQWKFDVLFGAKGPRIVQIMSPWIDKPWVWIWDLASMKICRATWHPRDSHTGDPNSPNPGLVTCDLVMNHDVAIVHDGCDDCMVHERLNGSCHVNSVQIDQDIESKAETSGVVGDWWRFIFGLCSIYYVPGKIWNYSIFLVGGDWNHIQLQGSKLPSTYADVEEYWMQISSGKADQPKLSVQARVEASHSGSGELFRWNWACPSVEFLCPWHLERHTTRMCPCSRGHWGSKFTQLAGGGPGVGPLMSRQWKSVCMYMCPRANTNKIITRPAKPSLCRGHVACETYRL